MYSKPKRAGRNSVFSHIKQFQYNAQPDAPDPIFAKQLQELLGYSRDTCI